MSISLWTAKNLVRVFRECSDNYVKAETQPRPSEIVAGAITHDLPTHHYTDLRIMPYFQESDQRLVTLTWTQRNRYNANIKFLIELDESHNSAAKFVIAFFTLVESEHITDDKLDLFSEAFFHLEQTGLPTDKYSAAFINIVEKGATYEELNLFTNSAVTLLQAGEPIDELAKNIDFSINILTTARNERRDLVTGYCNRATEAFRKTYQTTVNRIAKYITYIPKTVIGIVGKAALIIFG